jgi:hypothetical protein
MLSNDLRSSRSEPVYIHKYLGDNDTTVAPAQKAKVPWTVVVVDHATILWTKWKPSRARQNLFDDLEAGLLPVNMDDLLTEEAWDIMCSSHMAEFIEVVFSQFEENLRDHGK